MMEHAARARKWMLWAAPVMALAGLFRRAGGAAAGLALWIGLGLLLSIREKRILLYPKQRRMKIHRLFLGYSFCVFCLAGFGAADQWLLGRSPSGLWAFLFLLGNVGFSLPLGVWAMQWPVSRKHAYGLCCLFFALFWFFTLGLE